MQTIDISTAAMDDADAGAVACFVAATDDGPVVGADAEELASGGDVSLAAALDALHVTGAAGDVARIPLAVAGRTVVVLVVGVGPVAEVDAAALRLAAAAAARAATRDVRLAVIVPGDIGASLSDEHRAEVVTEGAALGAYAYTDHRTKAADTPDLRGLVVVAGRDVDAEAVARAADRGAVTARATALARDLVNTPPAAKRPPDLAERIVELATAAGLTARVHDEHELADGGFGGLIGVGRGSSAPPRLVELTYPGDGADAHVVLVGKGITFDSGGLSLKPSQSMTTMKSDMSGAAAIVGAMVVAAEHGVRARVTGLLALAENMPDGDATRVSDVLTHRNGTTVEVLNTDAEGRLVLADALAYGQELEPTVMIDLATLTGAQIVALGNRIAAIMGTDDALVDALVEAGSQAGESLWRLPLPDAYVEHLRSEVADLRNIGRQREAGTVVAGLFLREFVGEVPWAHLDIAGPAFDESGDSGLGPKGGTGFGVRTLLRYLATLG